MIDYKKNLQSAIIAKVSEHFSVPYPKIEEIAKEQEINSDENLFFFGNIQRGKYAKNEMEDLRKYKPEMVVKFLLIDKAFSTKGENISSGFQSIYFTIKKDTKDDK
jgi:hypothetical protein